MSQVTQSLKKNYLLSAIRKLPQSSYSLTMVCPIVPDRELRRMVPGHVEFVSRRLSFPELAALYQQHDLFVMPSLIEGFGLVYLEAMGQGLPIVCTENTGGADIISDGV